jgi:hypothetical protein
VSSEYAPSGSSRTPVSSGEGDDAAAILTSGLQRVGVDLADVGRQRPAACEQCRGGDERSGRQPGGDRAAFLVR